MSKHRFTKTLLRGLVTLAYDSAARDGRKPQTVGLIGQFAGQFVESARRRDDHLVSIGADIVYMMSVMIAAAEAALTQLEEEE